MKNREQVRNEREACMQRCAEKHNLVGHPKLEAAFDIAWSSGHSAGLHEVEQNFDELAVLLEPVPATPPDRSEAGKALDELADEALGNGNDWDSWVLPKMKLIRAAMGTAPPVDGACAVAKGKIDDILKDPTASIQGTYIHVGPRACIVTHLGRVEWFDRNAHGGIHIPRFATDPMTAFDRIASADNESTSAPWWAIIKPTQNMSRDPHVAAQQIIGPFFSRQDAEDHRQARIYEYGSRSVVYCMSGYWSKDYRDFAEKAVDKMYYQRSMKLLKEAIEPFVKFGRSYLAKPLHGIHDNFYNVHAGTVHEGQLNFSDFRKAVDLYDRAMR